MFHVIVTRDVSARLGQLLSNRAAVIRVLIHLRERLENHADQYRGRRDPDDPDLFDYTLSLYVAGVWRTLRFSVNDTQATGYLFVQGVSASR